MNGVRVPAQLTDILKEFFKQTERTNPHVQEHFIYFLKERAGRLGPMPDMHADAHTRHK